MTPLLFNINRVSNTLTKRDTPFILLIPVLIISLIITPAPFFVALLSMKDLAFILLIYFLGLLSYHRNVLSSGYINNHIKILAILLIVSGVISIYLHSSNWDLINVNDYFTKRFQGARFASLLDENRNVLPPGFQSYIGTNAFPRNVSTILDAPGYSRALSWFVVYFGLKLMIDIKKLRLTTSLFYFFVLFAMQLTTIGRGGIIISILSLLIFVPYAFNLKFFKTYRTMIYSLTLGAVILFDITSDANFTRHMVGLLYGLSDISILGGGLGTAGQQVANYASESVTGYFSRESFVGGLAAQLGVVGIAVFSWITLSAYKNLVENLKIRKNLHSNQYIIFIVSNSVLVFSLLTSVFANSAVSFFSIAIPLYFYAAFLKYYSYK